MTQTAIFFLALGLSMDAFAVSLSNGFSVHRFGRKDALRQAVCFGGFQFLMPLLGWYLGSRIQEYLDAVDHWIAFGFLAVIGINMIAESISAKEPQEKELSFGILLMQAVATSIDAMAAGVSLAFLQVHILSAATVIGCISFVLSLLGSALGKCVGNRLQTKAELFGGVVLILMGLHILATHLLLY